ncbi:putative alternative oxidase, mitochondrial [Venustampulla echinocandica]|uniref:Alternative oxidase n=1 Tax=Venustampulla echinocandica TaxID=2656787 RepID=A0A370TME4_9HELO|nr:putative alternative oxidase, mitochondrial [Venustampulla echinocandica]RDL36700.1 putative alternative oxidase, mitochondrial [Venustampulla echinocandica]
MDISKLSTALPLSRPQLSKAVAASMLRSCSAHGVAGCRPVLGSYSLHLQQTQSSIQSQNRRQFSSTAKFPLQARRQFSSTARTSLKAYFPEPETEKIRTSPPAWPHPGFTVEQMRDNVAYAHRQPRDFSDRVALTMVRLLRFCMDTATGYKHNVEQPKKPGDANAVAETKPYGMDERKWLIRMVFLESVAGVPGMVAGMLRHLHSLRRMKRDNGWIETLLEESQNERMHLLTFLKMAEPGWFMRVMILGAQGVFFNSMFLSYLVSPRTCHRFVGYLEEEAVLTYTLAIEDVEAGRLPKWTDPSFVVPDLAVNYWKMPESNRTMRDLLLYIRADEAKHREVNHTLGNLNQKEDPNPFVSSYKDPNTPHPSKGLEHVRPTGWERKEVI